MNNLCLPYWLFPVPACCPRVGTRFRYEPAGSGYPVDHRVNTCLTDSNGNLVRILPHGTSTEDMLQEVARLLP